MKTQPMATNPGLSPTFSQRCGHYHLGFAPNALEHRKGIRDEEIAKASSEYTSQVFYAKVKLSIMLGK